jgi:hypothetical protein
LFFAFKHFNFANQVFGHVVHKHIEDGLVLVKSFDLNFDAEKSVWPLDRLFNQARLNRCRRLHKRWQYWFEPQETASLIRAFI